MKGSTVMMVVGLVVIVVVFGVFAFRETEEDVLAPEVEPVFEDASQMVEMDVNVSSGDDIPVSSGEDAGTEEPDTDTVTTTVDKPAGVTISINESGFTPDTVSVPVGTTITFVNDGQGKHWPASDVHPTHQILPEFDSKRGLETGETYSYTFTQVGTWSMHDHVRASNTGSITVE